MSRRKKTPFSPWSTNTNNGIEKRYIRLGSTQLNHISFIKLSNAAKVIYIYMLNVSGGKRIFEFPYSKYRYLMSKPTFLKAKEELISSGFIEIEENRRHMYKSTIYKFSCRWKE